MSPYKHIQTQLSIPPEAKSAPIRIVNSQYCCELYGNVNSLSPVPTAKFRSKITYGTRGSVAPTEVLANGGLAVGLLCCVSVEKRRFLSHLPLRAVHANLPDKRP